MDLKCGSCDKKDGLRRCTTCRFVYYCSKQCQKKDWQNHKELCAFITPTGIEKDTRSELCRQCRKSTEKLFRCSACKNVSYCSKECQQLDWKNGHKQECQWRGKSYLDTASQSCVICGENGELKRCTGCNTTFYCSVECQKAHWPNHKICCQRKDKPHETKQSTPFTAVSPICAYCRKNECHIQCDECESIYYCSNNCRGKDLEKHKALCRRASRRNKDTLSEIQCKVMGLVTPDECNGQNPNEKKKFPDPENINENFSKGLKLNCVICGKKDNVRPCKRCNSTMYCSDTCEYIHREEHEETCDNTVLLSSYQPELSFTFGRTDSGKYLISTFHSPPHSFLSGKSPMYVEDGADLNLIVERSEEDRRKAMQYVKRKFPAYSLITRVREIPMESTSIFESNICHIRNVFLAFIRRYHGYRGRHNIYLQDSERREIYVSFYLPKDDPTPYFQWSQLVPGAFISLLFPCIHHFSDDSFGLRVDRAANVMCFEIK